MEGNACPIEYTVYDGLFGYFKIFEFLYICSYIFIDFLHPVHHIRAEAVGAR